jgi:hypothetical protein
VIGPQEKLVKGNLEEILEAGADRTAEFLTDILTKYPADWQFWDAFVPGGLLVEAE